MKYLPRIKIEYCSKQCPYYRLVNNLYNSTPNCSKIDTPHGDYRITNIPKSKFINGFPENCPLQDCEE